MYIYGISSTYMLNRFINNYMKANIYLNVKTLMTLMRDLFWLVKYIFFLLDLSRGRMVIGFKTTYAIITYHH